MTSVEAVSASPETQALSYMVNRVWQFLLFCYDRRISGRLRLDLPGGPMELPVEFSAIFRIHAFLDRLIGEVLPIIRRKIEFEENEVQVSTASGVLKGQILWNESLANWHRLPREYSYVDPIKVFTTPENILTVLTLLQTRSQCYDTFLKLEASKLDGNPLSHLVVDEIGKSLRRAVNLIDVALHTSHLSDSINSALSIIDNEVAVRRLHQSVEQSIRMRAKINVGYRRLLEWRRDFFQELSIIEGVQGSTIHFVHIGPPKVYEIYALVELLSALQVSLRPLEITLNSGEATATFRQPASGTGIVQSVRVFYNRVPKGPQSWIAHAKGEGLIDGAVDASSLAGLPDIFIEAEYNTGQKEYAIADFKFSTRPTYITDSRFKTLGYMYEFDIPRGMLIFGGAKPIEVEEADQAGEKDVKDTIFLADQLSEKRGASFYNLSLRRKLVVVLVDPRPESEAKNHKALARAVETLFAF